ELLQTDAAGKEILNLLNKLAQAATHTNSQWDWLSFRHWLGVKLEENYFSPCNQFEHAVELLHLSQTALRKFDGVIIGNMIREQFPGTIKQTPFFNQSVRQELGLKALVNQRHIKYYYFRQLIESAPLILLSYHSGPQESLLSPWLELLSRFHQLAFDQSLESQILHQLMQRQTANNSPRNDTKKRNPPPTITSAMLPGSLSASAHQTLIQCPYAFFASQILKLRATEEISEKLAKSDYGERVHLCLQAFHAGGIKQVDGPFPNTIHSANKKQAIDMLSNIAKQVFANDLEDNFQHRGWLKRWLEIIPSYIDWQIQHETNWRFKNGEIKTTSQLTENLKLHGRIDRIDQSSEELNIIDYKTGSTPATQQVENGEAIQLTHYALSSPENVSRVGYLQFGGSKADIAEKCVLEDETLTNLKEQARIRLIKIYQALANGAELPAWGEEKVCQYCQFDGLCRHKLQ
ncbi:MAG TPA: PD-(D/E)XK nuclease family protein, partial [Gammaproteobacteria bacterium]|nr:PD-(D/E)XK nuclease family protein [Gammaproteobacteria bacterium]